MCELIEVSRADASFVVRTAWEAKVIDCEFETIEVRLPVEA
jgi:hypothetical protein